MSNALGIAATTAVMREMLQRHFDGAGGAGILPVVGGVTVSALPPDRITTGAAEPSVLNLFLYMVTPNPGWRNVDLASRDASGGRLTKPPLALDLHYMMSAYGKADFFAEIILGHGLQVLFEFPVLTRPLIQQIFSGPLTPPLALLSTSGLADQEELIKLTPQLLTTEELSKLWTGFQDKYRATAAFMATVVLIRSDEQVASGGLPVRMPLVFAQPLPKPFIAGVDPPIVPYDPNATVALVGSQLLASGSRVQFLAGAPITPAPGSTPSRVVALLAAGLLAGPNTVRLLQPVAMGDPPVDHLSFESNTAAFVLRPVIKDQPGTTVPDITVAGGQVTVKVAPDVGRRQVVTLLLDSLAGAPSYSVQADARSLDLTDTVVFTTAPAAGTYLVRVRVDGAETALQMDSGGTYSAPTVTVP
jgi:hypothetical protein